MSVRFVKRVQRAFSRTYSGIRTAAGRSGAAPSFLSEARGRDGGLRPSRALRSSIQGLYAPPSGSVMGRLPSWRGVGRAEPLPLGSALLALFHEGLKICLDEAVEIAVEHPVHVSDFEVRAVVLDEPVGSENVRADLRPEPDLHLRARAHGVLRDALFESTLVKA